MEEAASLFGCSYSLARNSVYEVDNVKRKTKEMNPQIKIKNEVDCTTIDIEGTIGLSEEWQFDNPESRVATYERFKECVAKIADIRNSHIVVNIRSTGGDVNDAMLIYEALRATGAHITTRCYGYTASAATIVAQAASEGCREIAPTSLYLIHKSLCSTEGNAEAAFDYAYCLMNGYGVERDPALAKSFYVFASHTVGEAAYNLAVMYLRGNGVKRNYKKTFEYMKDAAELGVIEAQLYLGVAYTLGSLFEPDVVSISLIPYHTQEYTETVAYIEGEAPDYEADEEARIAAVRHDPHSAFSWFKNAAKHSPDYVVPQPSHRRRLRSKACTRARGRLRSRLRSCQREAGLSALALPS